MSLKGRVLSKLGIERALTKLIINAYSDREMKRSAGGIEAMYNPSSIDLQYTGNYTPIEYINQKQVINQFSMMRPSTLYLELMFDAKLPDNTESIDNQLDQLRAVCCSVNKETGEPRFLKVQWGNMRWNDKNKRYFAGRLQSLAISYTLFDRDATPLRAVAKLGLEADESLVLQKAIQGELAPKKVAIVAPMGPLPTIATIAGAAVGSAAVDYLGLAVTNGLNNLYAIEPGSRLVVTTATGR